MAYHFVDISRRDEADDQIDRRTEAVDERNSQPFKDPQIEQKGGQIEILSPRVEQPPKQTQAKSGLERLPLTAAAASDPQANPEFPDFPPQIALFDDQRPIETEYDDGKAEDQVHNSLVDMGSLAKQADDHPETDQPQQSAQQKAEPGQPVCQ